jgi:reactive intermediate/imine deaminase
MKTERVNPPSLMKPVGSYCQVVRKGNVVTVAGMVAVAADGTLVGAGDIRAQTRKAVENMVAALAAVGGKPSDVLKVTIYISDFVNFAGMNEVFDEVFKNHPPARATVQAKLLRSEWLVEMDAFAVVEA